jgi:hypothetical protein
MPYPEWFAGQTITAALLNAGKMEFVTNTATATNSTTTMADVPGLGFAVTANSRWWVMAEIAYDGPTTDVKFAWTAPSGATMGRNIISQAASTATNVDTNAIFIRRGTGTAQTVGGPASVASAFSVHSEIVDLQVGSTAGTAQFQFAEVAGGTATVQADSMIWYMQVA